jgi:hypothetical protein
MFIEAIKHTDGRAALRMLGKFSGKGELREIEFAFRKKSVTVNSGLLAEEKEIHLETGRDPETGEGFYVNGQGELLMEHIKRCADGKKIICQDEAIASFANIFKPNELSLAK